MTSIFPLGDPQGQVTWPPSLLKRVFPRRELKGTVLKKPPKPGDLDEMWANSAHNIEEGWWVFESAASEPELSEALLSELTAARPLLSSPRPTRPLALEQNRALFHLCTLHDQFRVNKHADAILDWWVQQNGILWAMETFLFACQASPFPGSSSMVVMARVGKAQPGYGKTGEVHTSVPQQIIVDVEHCSPHGQFRHNIPAIRNGTHANTAIQDAGWVRMRTYLATASDKDWDACQKRALELAEVYRGPFTQAMLAWLFPELPERAEAVVRAQNPYRGFLGGCVRKLDGIDFVRTEMFWQYYEECMASVLASVGPDADAFLADHVRKSYKAPYKRMGRELLSLIQTERARMLLAGLG